MRRDAWRSLQGFDNASDRHGLQRFADPLVGFGEQTMARGIISAVQGMLESGHVRRTVAFENQPAQPQQSGAVVAAIVNACLEALQDGPGSQSAQP